MNSFIKNTKGAISIFLVIILLPMLTVAGIMIDSSRIHLAKSVTASAVDLTLNSGLTKYDTMLKDIYGIFAMAQDEKEVKNELNDYFKKCIAAQGISGAEADDIVGQAMDYINNASKASSSSDALMAQVEGDLNITFMPNSALDNPGILKNQIVDFMKYRAPIGVGASFLDSLKGFTTLKDQNELVEKRQEYCEQEEDLLKKCQAAWDAISKYNTAIRNNGANNTTPDSYLGEIGTSFGSYKGQYETINNSYIRNIVNASGSNISVRYTIDKDDQTGEYFYEDLTQNPNRQTITYSDYSETNRPTAEQLQTIFNKFESIYNSIVNSYPSGNYYAGYNGDQNYVQVQTEVQYNRDYITKAVDLLKAYTELNSSLNYADDATKYTVITLFSVNKAITDQFNDVTAKFNEQMGYADSGSTKINNINSTVNSLVSSSKTTVNGSMKNIQNQINGYRGNVKTAIDQLKTAIDNLTDVKKSIEPGGALQKAKDNWLNKANTASIKDDPLAIQDRADISQLNKSLSADEVGKLINRLTTIKSNLDALYAETDKYSYGSKKLYQMGANEDIAGLTSNWNNFTLTKTPIIESDMKPYVDYVFTNSIKVGNVNVGWKSTDQSQPNLDIAPQLNFYIYLKQKFGNIAKKSADYGKQAEDTKNAYKDAADENEKKAKAAAEKGYSSSNEILGQKDLPSDNKTQTNTNTDKSNSSDDAIKKNSTGLSFLSSLSDNLSQLGAGFRDNIYVSDYILNMFSYASYQNEIAWELDGKKPNFTPPDIYDKDGKYIWNNDKFQQKAVTLTKWPINPTNNFDYGREVEYILYGGKNSDNRVKANATIFAIRLGLNTIYAFMDGEIRETALSISSVVPPPFSALAYFAIIVGLSIAESSNDLVMLNEGMAVPIFKNSQTWVIKPSHMLSVIGQKALDYAEDFVTDEAKKAIDLGTSKLNDWLNYTDEELTEKIKTNSEDAKNQITKAFKDSFDTIITQNADSVIQTFTTLCDEAIERTKSSIDTSTADCVNYVKSNLASTVLSGETDENSLTYKAKKAALDYINSDLDNLVKKYVDLVNEKIDDVKPSDKAQAVYDFLKSIKDDINNNIEKGADTLTSEILNYKKAAVEKIENSITSGGQKLKDTITNSINGTFGGNNGTESAASKKGVSSLFSFQYSDYMRLFLLIGLYTNNDAIMKRTADVIQVNMKKNPEPDFLMKNAYTYLKLEANIAVKPAFLALPFITETTDQYLTEADKKRVYKFTYSDFKGY